MHIGQSSIDAVVAYDKLSVIDAQQVQDGRVDVVDLRRIVAIQWFVAPLITRAIGGSAANPSAT